MGWDCGDFRIACIHVGQHCRDRSVYEVGSKTIEVFTSGVGIPIKSGYCIAVVPYALMKGCPVSARMRDAGSPFLLKGAGVLGHILFIDCESCIAALILDLI